jgi:SAM-dependent methyltransferase
MNSWFSIMKTKAEHSSSLLSRVYNFIRWQVQKRITNRHIIDDEMVAYLMEFYGLTRKETLRMLKSGRDKVFAFWREMSPKSPQEIVEFYKRVPYEVFSLAYQNMTVSQRRFRDELINYCFGDVLDFGGGIGDLSIKLAEKGLNVTYADVKGKNMEFARWLFNKKGLRIKVIDATEPLPQNYDTILCLYVIEHVPDAKETLTKLCKALKPNGRLIITNYDYKGGDGNPLHRPITFDAEKLMESMGLRKTSKNWLWVKVSNGTSLDNSK